MHEQSFFKLKKPTPILAKNLPRFLSDAIRQHLPLDWLYEYYQNINVGNYVPDAGTVCYSYNIMMMMMAFSKTPSQYWTPVSGSGLSFDHRWSLGFL